MRVPGSARGGASETPESQTKQFFKIHMKFLATFFPNKIVIEKKGFVDENCRRFSHGPYMKMLSETL